MFPFTYVTDSFVSKNFIFLVTDMIESELHLQHDSLKPTESLIPKPNHAKVRISGFKPNIFWWSHVCTLSIIF